MQNTNRHALFAYAGRTSPYFEGTEAEGATEYMTYNNVHMPMSYGREFIDEYKAMKERVTLWDVGGERQTELRGPDAVRLADLICTRDMKRRLEVGKCVYTLLSDEEGQIMGDPIVLRPWDDVVWISHGDTDVTLWAKGIAMYGDFDVEICEPDVSPVQVQGPNAPQVLKKVCDEPEKIEALKYYQCCVTSVIGIEVVVSRTGWNKGMGFEIYPTSSDRGMEMWNAIKEAGKEFDMLVTGPNIVVALEQGITDICYWTNSGQNVIEAGGERLCDLEVETPFIGRDALRKIVAEGAARQTVGLIFDKDTHLPRHEYNWELEDSRGNAGLVRWAIPSIALERDIAIALVDSSVQMGETVKVNTPDGIYEGEVTALPFVQAG